MSKIIIYTDGACRGNPGLGAWAAVLMDESDKYYLEIAESVAKTTNNKMELLAAVEALKAIKKPSEIMLYTDSMYLVNGMTKWIQNWVRRNWTKSDKKPVENKEFWQQLLNLSEKHNITFNWVKAHNGDKYNERVDGLANFVMDKHIANKSTFAWKSRDRNEISL